MRVIGYIALGITLGAAACAAQPRARVAQLPPQWQRVRNDGDSVAFRHRAGGTIVSATSCADGDDVPLEVLTNHLLLGIEGRRERAREAVVLDGSAALRTRLDATLDGVFMAMELVVLKKDGCTIDLYMVAPPRAFEARRADFDRFVAEALDQARP